jgi:hypothetical protein
MENTCLGVWVRATDLYPGADLRGLCGDGSNSFVGRDNVTYISGTQQSVHYNTNATIAWASTWAVSSNPGDSAPLCPNSTDPDFLPTVPNAEQRADFENAGGSA